MSAKTMRVLRGAARAVSWLGNRAAGLLAVGSALCICVVALAVSADVMRRQLVGPAIPGVVEFSVVLLVVMVFFGLAQAHRTGQEITVDVITVRLQGRARAAVEALALLIGIVVLFPIMESTWENALASYARGEYRYGLLRVPVWPARMAIPIGLAAYLLLLVISLVHRLRELVAGTSRGAVVEVEEELEESSSRGLGGM